MKISVGKNKSEQGFVYIILSLIVIIVVGTMVYQVARLLHKVNDKPKNDDTTYYSTGDGTTWSAINTSDTNPPANPFLLTPADLTTNSFCTFQYKVLVDTNDIPFTTLVMGTNMVDGTITALIDTPEEYEITFTIGSQVYIEDYDAVSGGLLNESVTDAYQGDPCVAIVQRDDGSGWQDISTNDPCNVGLIYTFTDPQPPCDHALYRLKIQ